MAKRTYEYGDTRNPMYDAEWTATSAWFRAEMAECRYCKAARTRAAKQGKEVSGCKSHRESMRLAWATSPRSETYWAS